MKGVDLYGRVRYAVQIEGLSHREAARRFGIDLVCPVESGPSPELGLAHFRQGRPLASRGIPRVVIEDFVLTPDLIENQLVVWIFHSLQSRGLGTARQQAEMASLLMVLAKWVSLRACSPRDYAEMTYDARTERYRELHQLCALLLVGAGVDIAAGNIGLGTFGVSTSRIFELAVLKALSDLGPGWTVHAQERVSIGSSLSFIVDGVIRDHSGAAVAVLDAKYKNPLELDVGDIQQATAYCAALGVRRAMLVYPENVASAAALRVGEFEILTGTMPIGDELGLACASLVNEVRTRLLPPIAAH